MVLVTGGTGLVGAHLLLHLAKEQDRVRAIHRPDSDLQTVKRVFSYYTGEASELFQKIEWVIADLTDIPALELAFRNIEWVYHAAAMISFDPNDFRALMKTNAEGTANIVNLCIAHSVKKLCYVSTIGTIGKAAPGEPATEESEWNHERINVYAQSKYAAEMEVWRGSQEGLAVVMVNPGVILGPGSWHTGTGALFRTAHKGYRFYPPGGTGFVSVHDVVRMMTLLMHSSIVDQRYIAVAQNWTFFEILSRMCPLLGQSPPTKELKFWQLHLARLVDILWNLISGSGRKLTQAAIHSMKYRDVYSSAKVQEALQFEFEPLAPVIEFSCARFMEEYP